MGRGLLAYQSGRALDDAHARACVKNVRGIAESVGHGARIDDPSRTRTAQTNVASARRYEYRAAGALLGAHYSGRMGVSAVAIV